MYLLGIDIGTSGTKTVLFDTKGKQVASALEEYGMAQPKAGWAEQNPEDWWHAVANTIKQVIDASGIEPDQIKGIGLSGQMHGLVLLDEHNQVIRPSIIWCDQRTQKQCDDMTAIVGRDKLIEITGNPAITGFTASKILWVKDNEPKNYERVHHILLPKDYIRLKLTGVYATEVSDASGMQLLDIEKRDWSDELLELLGIDRNLLAKVYESVEVTGGVTADVSQLTGLAKGTPVVGGAGDQAAGAIGNGIIAKGHVSATIGTSGVVFAHTDKPLKDPKGRIQTFCHALPGAWHVMGVTQGAGLSLRWYRDNFCTNEQHVAEDMGCDPYELMTKEAAQAEVGSKGLMYLPYLMGERTPHLDPYAKGVFFGIAPSHTKRDMIRAIMEGVTYSLRDCLTLIHDLGIETNTVRVSGGGSKSALWRQMQADIYDRPVTTIHASEGPALGVAILAGVGTGVFSSVEEACEQLIDYGEGIQPNTANHQRYMQFYTLYAKLYAQLKDTFKAHQALL
ncbi:xylulokinase [Vallitalea pronyensis]|uniref:Xylulose kinase n=1 Tax=Vallitalea pronyensis TaxID=1348613 RepID=A0A8J8MIR4_9FIRM|nr:xylulokinase [Vallitalea pronyensis]QUI22400.1 xylulokinase [Vallitalea pronyensis]